MPFYIKGRLNRELLILIWQYSLFKGARLSFSNSAEYEILSSGLRTESRGVNFAHSKIRNVATGELLTGSVRIDCRSSDWDSHNAPDVGSGVILHLVFERDSTILVGGDQILTCTLTPPPSLLNLLDKAPLECTRWFADMESSGREALLERIAIDRLSRKSEHITELAQKFGGDWAQAAYVAFVSSMGYSGKKEMFERLAMSLPLHYIERHFGRPEMIEALMLGQAGFLDVENVDDYTAGLIGEFAAARAENALLPAPLNWQSAGVRIYSAPAISIVRVAHLLCKTDNLLQNVLGCNSVTELHKLFDVVLPDYWKRHRAPSELTRLKGLENMSEDKINLLIVNFVAPLIVAYGHFHSIEHYPEKAIDLLENIGAESNTHTRRFQWAGYSCRSAYVSQTLIELGSRYCTAGSCAACPLFQSIAMQICPN